MAGRFGSSRSSERGRASTSRCPPPSARRPRERALKGGSERELQSQRRLTRAGPELKVELLEQRAPLCAQIFQLIAERALLPAPLSLEQRGEYAQADGHEAGAEQRTRHAPRALLVLLVHIAVAVGVVSLVVAPVLERLLHCLGA